MREDFERDLTDLLDTLEKVWRAQTDHVFYVRAYKYFMHKWAPKKEKMKLDKNDL
jgi:hypothetical protein